MIRIEKSGYSHFFCSFFSLLPYNSSGVRMNFAKQLLGNKKISIFLDKNGICHQASLYNVKELKQCQSNRIEIDNFSIMGEGLIITRMEDYEITIEGKIEKMEFAQAETKS